MLGARHTVTRQYFDARSNLSCCRCYTLANSSGTARGFGESDMDLLKNKILVTKRRMSENVQAASLKANRIFLSKSCTFLIY